MVCIPPTDSTATSAPTPFVSSSTLSVSSPGSALVMWSAPIFCASCACCGYFADAMTLLAPNAFALAIDDSPMGADPTTATISPGFICAYRSPCTDTAIGSTSAPSVQSISSGSLNSPDGLRVMYSAKPPPLSGPKFMQCRYCP